MKGEIKMKVTIDSFITNTRMRLCKNVDCQHNLAAMKHPDAGLDCHLKMIEIDEAGQCIQFEPVEDGVMFKKHKDPCARCVCDKCGQPHDPKLHGDDDVIGTTQSPFEGGVDS